MARLKEATREQHEHLESVVDVMDAAMTLNGYKALLTKFYKFYAAIESAIEGIEMDAVGFDFDSRRKLPLLEKDLRNLRADAPVTPWTGTPLIDSHARAFGALYVLEGATLGGQIITRHLKQHFAIDADSGGAFFNSYGAEVGPMWKAFGAAVTSFNEREGQDEEIIAAARDTFDSFAKCFESAGEHAGVAQIA